ncbi:SDR family NAD(P)-dependent oxidoreductase [Loktanella sp. SALINAS62]|uniref:SDR family NAD(P)-dependent oxidoreductase n=1 Tax=Loktanella sp. SALINAS62 TaxID=2706124 RepID=UPI001B8DA430|nr:SDR family NAD(P)-dependent oxidoreductase [Loktanella sp. SALINAS62]MBS1302184.1 SDR family NAD(P)-dependent oxidoreductase [Loktanella sp. SALINAS62]
MTQKNILITGCSSGIGYDAAHGLRDAGWRVFASCRKQADCDRMHALGFDSPRIDYADPHTIRDGLAEVLLATGGTLDALYNNGAFACPGAVEDLPRGGLESIFQTNLFGVHDLTVQVIPVMRAQGHGRIVNCSSVLGLVGYKWRGAYVATKFALEGLTDVLRMEMADTGIKVILLEPGPIASRIRENAIPHFERWFDTENSARRDQYDDLKKRLYKGGDDKFQLPASAVTAKLRRALEHPRPKPRYYITTPTYLAGAMRRVLSTRLLDAVISRG